MKSTIFAAAAMALMLAACTTKDGNQSQANAEQPANGNENASVVVANEEAAEMAPAPKNGVLSEQKGPIDPKSVEAAGQVVQHYGALIEQGRWGEAERLWNSREEARKEAASDKQEFSEVHLEIGKPGQAEGAAGSIYVAIPGAYYGRFKDGERFRHSVNFVLRRINEVPGSAPEQWRWHIERIESAEEF